MKTVSECELAYAAGFFDGEGSITITCRTQKNGRYKYYAMLARITQVDINPLLFMQEKFGGGIYPTKRPSGKPISVWQVSARNAEEFLIKIYKYSIVKKDEIDIALKFRKTMLIEHGHRNVGLTDNVINFRDSLIKEMKNLRIKKYA